MRSIFCVGLALVACGDSNPKNPDAAVSDAATSDGPNVDAAPQSVTVTVTQDGQPQSDVRVYFQNADSSLVSSALTDAQGKASALMQTGGYVTAIDPYQITAPGGVSIANELYTFAGVKPGDQLRLDRNDSPGIIVNLTAPFDTSSAATSYSVSTSCSSSADSLSAAQGSAGPATGTVYLDGCAGQKVDFLLVTKDMNDNPVNYIFVADVTVSDQMNLDLTAMNPAPQYTAAAQRNYTWTNVATTSPIGYADYLATNRGMVFEHSGETSGSPTATAMNNMPAFTGAVNLVETRQAGDGASHRVLEWGPYSSTHSLDLGANLLPDFMTYPSFDEPTRSFTWTATGGAVQPDFIFSEVDVYRNGAGRRWVWTIAAPHTASSLRFPTVPTDVYDFNITAADNTELWGLALAKVPGGYDAVRAGLLASNGPQDLIAGATGRISVATLPQLIVQRQAPRTKRADGWRPAKPFAARR